MLPARWGTSVVLSLSSRPSTSPPNHHPGDQHIHPNPSLFSPRSPTQPHLLLMPEAKRPRLDDGPEVEGAQAVDLASAPGKDKERAAVEGSSIANISMGVNDGR